MLSRAEIKNHLKAFPVRNDIVVDILTGPTAVGKNWVVDRLKTSHKFLIPTTSRPQRSDEEHGVQYYFVSKKKYEELLLKGEFITTFTMGNQYYGYQKSVLEEISTQKYIPLATIYYKVLDPFLEKFPNSRIYFMFPTFTKKGLELLRKRMLSRTVWQFEARWKDTLEQMRAMYETKPTLLEKYPNSKLYAITNDKSALKLIKDMQKNK